MFYQDRLDSDAKPRPLRPILGTLNQRLMEHGWTTPWIMTSAECREYWGQITNDLRFEGNRPEDYARKSTEVVRFLHELWLPHVRRDDTILELGCNCGANLDGLRTLGYGKLTGIEINHAAVAHLRKVFPDLAKHATITRGSLEDTLPQLPSRSCDVLLTMAVLIHLHPSSRQVFQEMVRVARKYICVVELEAANCDYVFARSYRRVFERLGARQVHAVTITGAGFPHVPASYHGYTARLFAVGDGAPTSPQRSDEGFA